MNIGVPELLLIAVIIFLLFGTKKLREGANKRGNSSRLTQSFHFFSLSRSFLP